MLLSKHNGHFHPNQENCDYLQVAPRLGLMTLPDGKRGWERLPYPYLRFQPPLPLEIPPELHVIMS